MAAADDEADTMRRLRRAVASAAACVAQDTVATSEAAVELQRMRQSLRPIGQRNAGSSTRLEGTRPDKQPQSPCHGDKAGTMHFSGVERCDRPQSSHKVDETMEEVRIDQDARAAKAAAFCAKVQDDPKYQAKRRYRESLWKKFGGPVIEQLLETANLVDGRYVLALARAGGVLPRGQDVPRSAVITPDTVWRLKRWNEIFSLPVLVLSYPWLETTHPDRSGVLLRRIAPILDAMVTAAEKGGGKHATIGVMIDYCSLPQLPFRHGEHEQFQKGLNMMHAWYSHPFTHTLLVTTPLPDKALNSRPYTERGWCFFELRMASLIKNAEMLWDLSNYAGQKSYDALRSTLKMGREPPASPDRVEVEMRRRIEEGTLSFSYSEDIEPVIAMYQRGFVNAFECYRQLRSIPPGAGTSIYYGRLRWSDAEAAILLEAINYVNEHCPMEAGSVEVAVPENRLSVAGQLLLEPFTMRHHRATVKDSAAPKNCKLFVTGLRNQFYDKTKSPS